MIQLMNHQKQVLDQTKDKNKVAVKDYEGLYEIDNEGNVYSLIQTKSRRKGLIKPYEKNGYLAVNLTNINGASKHYYTHRLVAQAFIPNTNNLYEVNHIDCNKHNNSVTNLEWCDRKRNLQHSYDNGLKRTCEKHGRHKLTALEVKHIRSEYIKGDRNHSLHALGKKYNVSWCTIQAIVTKRLWKEVI